eukprot:10233032-Prorocentrum_lima.AAC.1
MEAKHPEGIGELRKIGRSRCCYSSRTGWKTGEYITLQNGLCEEVPHSTADEGEWDNQDLEGKESN